MGRCFCDGGKSLLPGMTHVLPIGQETIFKVPDLSKGKRKINKCIEKVRKL